MTAITYALVEHGSGYRLHHDETVVAGELSARGIPWEKAPLSHVQRGRKRITDGGLAVGSIPFVKASLRHLGHDLPIQNCYPEELRPWLRRRVWKARLFEVLDRPPGRVFVKPADKLKAFMGCILGTPEDYSLRTVSGSHTVWCSEVVEWRSEWRAYVIGRDLAHLAFCCGDRGIRPDLGAIYEALAELRCAPAGFAIDFGVLADGKTALVEMNDGFSVGCYDDTPSSIYVDMLIARWKEMTTA